VLNAGGRGGGVPLIALHAILTARQNRGRLREGVGVFETIRDERCAPCDCPERRDHMAEARRCNGRTVVELARKTVLAVARFNARA